MSGRGHRSLIGSLPVRRALAAGVLLSGLLTVGATVPAVAAAGFTCGGTLNAPQPVPAGTLPSLTMPSGSVCLVVAPVTVSRGVRLGDGSALGVTTGTLTVMGGLTLGTGAAFGDEGNSQPINIYGPVHIGPDGAFFIGVETPGGPIVSRVVGPVTATGASAVQIHNTQIAGPVRLTGGGGTNAIVDSLVPRPNNFNDLEDNRISGPVSQVGYGGVWSGVIRNVIGGPFTFSNNAEPMPDEYDIGSNRIFGPATCNGNSPAPNLGMSPGASSLVYGPMRGDQAATCTGVASGVTGPPIV